MDLKSEENILKLISEDGWMMDILTTAKSLNLPDWWGVLVLSVQKFGILYMATTKGHPSLILM